jgi:FkbM family methyltransferase
VIRLRRFVKKVLFGYVPFLRGRFRYYEHTVYFPLGSIIFEYACADGLYERDVTDLIINLVEPGTTYFDVGSNIGLLSVPVLAVCDDVRVVSIEASPHTLPFLRKTHSVAKRKSDWTIFGTAVGAKVGRAEFWTGGGARGAFDGLKNTNRGGDKYTMHVPVRTLDDIWYEIGNPLVSVIKMDIEGGEYFALRGARELIARSKPYIILEWTKKNLDAYSLEPEILLALCKQIDYTAHAFPFLMPIQTAPALTMAMARTEMFVLVPVVKNDHKSAVYGAPKEHLHSRN